MAWPYSSLAVARPVGVVLVSNRVWSGYVRQQGSDQRRRGAGLADRDGMQPDHRAGRKLGRLAQALGPVLPVFRLLSSPPEQVKEHQGQQKPPGQGVEGAHAEF